MWSYLRKLLQPTEKNPLILFRDSPVSGAKCGSYSIFFVLSSTRPSLWSSCLSGFSRQKSLLCSSPFLILQNREDPVQNWFLSSPHQPAWGHTLINPRNLPLLLPQSHACTRISVCAYINYAQDACLDL